MHRVYSSSVELSPCVRLFIELLVAEGSGCDANPSGVVLPIEDCHSQKPAMAGGRDLALCG